MESIAGLECSQSSDDKLPSQEKNEAWIRADSPKKLEYLSSIVIDSISLSDSTKDEQFEDNTSIYTSKIGKWLLFNNIRKRNTNGLTPHDEAWLVVRELVSSNVLYSAKCSTVWKGPYAGTSSRHKGVICCYTTDYSAKQDVKRAADSIRKALHYPEDMFYKTDADTYAGKYQQSGSGPVSTYKHTIENVMYERGSSKKKWKLVDISN